MLLGNCELTIHASDDLGPLGGEVGDPIGDGGDAYPPVRVAWRWWYSVPALPLFVLLGLLALLPRANRRRVVWLVLLLPLCTEGFSLALTMVLPDALDFGMFLTALASAWAVLWLAAPWIGRTGRWARYAVSVAVLYGVGLIAWFSFDGADGESIMFLAVAWSLSLSVLYPPLVIAGLCSGRTYTAVRFLVWSIAWTVGIAFLTALGFVATMICLFGPRSPSEVLFVLFFASLTLLVAASMITAIHNLPILLISLPSEEYRQRCRMLFCHPEARDPWLGKGETRPDVVPPWSAADAGLGPLEPRPPIAPMVPDASHDAPPIVAELDDLCDEDYLPDEKVKWDIPPPELQPPPL